MEDSNTIIKRPRLTNDNVELNPNVVVVISVSLPVELMVNVMTNLDVRTLVEIKPVSRQWKHLATTAIDSKGIGTKQRKAFETNEELKHAVRRYCPLPQGNIDDETTKQEYCDREIAEDIACKYGWPINKWDVSQIEDFSGVFYGGEEYNEETDEEEYVDGIVLFNEDISDWDVFKATTMEEMFKQAKHFNQDLSTWDVSNVTNMECMFYNAKQFNQDLSTWNVSNITIMKEMFCGAKQFNQHISNWNVSNVTDMCEMFFDAEQFNQDLSTWNVSNVTTMEKMFGGASKFNQDLSNWDVSNVTDMSFMFFSAEQFNQDLSTWNVSNVTTMEKMFCFAEQFNQNISSWGERWAALVDSDEMVEESNGEGEESDD